MTTYVALLRGVNVGGRKKVDMADLRGVLDALGLAGGRTLLQSGNLVFRDAGRPAAVLERALEAGIVERLGLETVVFVRTARELEAVVAANPFPNEAAGDPAHLVVQFLKVAPTPACGDALRAAITGREVCRVQGREAYVVFPDGIGRSRLTTTVIERALGTHTTGRNWNTVVKLAALARG